MVLPDYENCGLNVISSVMNHLGAFNPHKTHPTVDSLLNSKEYRNIILMLFDGMGIDALERFCSEKGFFRSHLTQQMTAVYPSTTTNATTCIECGKSPVEHGWLGWTLYFEEIDHFVDIFLNTFDGKPVAGYPVAQTYIPRHFVFDTISAAGKAQARCISKYSNDIRVDTLDQVLDCTLSLCHEKGRHYIYTYWPEPDHTMHEQGIDTPEIGSIILDLEKKVCSLSESVPEDTLIMITADHGLINAKHCYIEDYPEISAALVRDIAIEERAASFYVKDEYINIFPDLFRNRFGDHFLLLKHDDFIHQFLGPGKQNPRLSGLVGDYMALSVAEDSLCMRRREHELKAVHAGLTAQEMKVPLITVQH